jgi:hypothetical protein
MGSTLTPSQLNAGAGLLQNQGIVANTQFTNAITSYNSNSTINPLLQTMSIGSGTGSLSPSTLTALKTLGANNCPSLSDSAPYGNIQITTTGFTGLLSTTANTYLGNGDLSVFCQAFQVANGYNGQTNSFVVSAAASQVYLGNSFTGMNDMLTGSITTVNTNIDGFAKDLKNLGQLFNLSNLGDLGSPLGLVQQIVNVAGNMPSISLAFLAVGIPQSIVVTLGDPKTSVEDSVQKLMYQAMLTITGDNLAQILQLLSVKTPNLTTMADLLNPYLLFPNSYQTLLAPTPNGFQNIYTGAPGEVNSALATQLPAYLLRSTA